MPLSMQPLFSGSRGNASLVQAGQTRLLIDAGVSARRLEGALQQVGVAPDTLDGILITHEHSDHIQGLNIFAARHRLKVYANEGTWAAMGAQCDRIAQSQRIRIDGDSDFYIRDLNIETILTPHDAACSMGYGFVHRGIRGLYLTDLGYISRRMLDKMLGCNMILLECNHDEDMLQRGPYPQSLKQRILGQRGHLSNHICGEALRRLVPAGLTHAALMHLSQENNTPALAYDSVTAALAQDNVYPGTHILLEVAGPEGPVAPLQLG